MSRKALFIFKSKKGGVHIFTELANITKPLIVIRGTHIIVCGNGDDIHSWLAPEAMRQANAFIIFDPDRSLYNQYAGAFQNDGFNVNLINTANIRASTPYNPFAYINGDRDVPKLAAALIAETKGKGNPGDIIFLTAETMLLTALISYIHNEAPDYELNINTLIEMLDCMEPEKYDVGLEYKDAVDYLFDEAEAVDAERFYIKQYRDFEEMMGEDAGSVIASCTERLSALKTPIISNFLSYNEIHIGGFNSPKTALFISTGNTGSPIDFVIPLIYTQLFDTMCDKCGN